MTELLCSTISTTYDGAGLFIGGFPLVVLSLTALMLILVWYRTSGTIGSVKVLKTEISRLDKRCCKLKAENCLFKGALDKCEGR